MTKNSNQKRMKLRKECREALATHIYNRLGLVIAPGLVRLQPRPEDRYAWSVTESNDFLLQSSLSSGTISLYQSICQALGHSLEAVTPQTLVSSQSGREVLSYGANCEVKANGSFTAKICELEAANLQLNEELGRTRSHLQSSLHESHTLHAQVSDLRHELHAVASENNSLRGEIAQTKMGIAGVIETLNTLNTLRKKIRVNEVPGDQMNAMNGYATTSCAKA
ncbi:hypothetical protein N7476_000299 [Penicillium atrosanguineum]|uniref:Uncharacterized protein n=1 Tax=Penicillium atrosanguineum TaxID=1132637 RepID=A0A9W9UBM5_9EURO|nr:hypothetical protein N7476_000299 [Penicillium atrosanguineum]